MEEQNSFIPNANRLTERVKYYPIVISLWIWLDQHYAKLKDFNFALKLALQLLEMTVSNAFIVTLAFVNVFRGPLVKVDILAGSLLGRFEKYAPILVVHFHTVYTILYALAEQNLAYLVSKIEVPFKRVQAFFTMVKRLWLNIFHKLLNLVEYKVEENLLNNHAMNKEPLHKHEVVFRNHKNKSQHNKEYCSAVDKSKLLSFVIYHSIRVRIFEQMQMLKMADIFYLNKMYKLIGNRLVRKNLATKLQDKFFLTKDKIDLYKEYLDVLTKQFTVQDGRSLDNVHVGF